MKDPVPNGYYKEIVEAITDTIKYPFPEPRSRRENYLFAIQNAIIKKQIAMKMRRELCTVIK